MEFQILIAICYFSWFNENYFLKDGNGEISQEEMEDVFLKMCKIVEKTEVGEITKYLQITNILSSNFKYLRITNIQLSDFEYLQIT